MDRNINEFGRHFHRHSFHGKQEDRPLLSILGLIATLADIYGWDNSYPVEKIFKLVSDEDNLRLILGEDIFTLKANLVFHESSGCYNLINDGDNALVAIKPNREYFINTVAGYQHEVYLVGSGSGNKD